MMDRKEISAFLIGCKPEELMAFKDYGDHVAAIGPDGKKYVYQADYLEQAVVKMEAAEQAVSSPGTTKQAKRKAPAKRAARKPATRSSTKTSTKK